MSSADRHVTFDSLTNGTSLTLYTEDSMTIDYEGFASSQGGSAHPGFAPFQTPTADGFLYSGGGSKKELSISTSDGMDAVGMEFTLGSGFGVTPVYAAWETYQDGLLVASGVFSYNIGDVVAFSDASGFDQLLIDTNSSPMTQVDENGGPGGTNAIALDDILVGFTVADAPLPEPGTYLVFGLGLIGLTVLRRRRKKLAA